MAGALSDDGPSRADGVPRRRQHRRILALLLSAVVVTGIGVMIYGVTRPQPPAAAPLPVTNNCAVPVPSSAVPVPSSHRSGSTTAAPSRLDAPLPSDFGATPAQPPVPQTEDSTGMHALQIRIPALGTTATIGDATVTNGILTPPRTPDVVGLWAGSAPLDGTSGGITLAGHVNWAGMAPFAFGKLADLHPGDLVYTTDNAARLTPWRITTVVARPKSEPVDAAAFPGANGPRTLSLITCGGAYDAASSSYAYNVYVTATPVT